MKKSIDDRPWTEARLFEMARATSRAFVANLDDREDALVIAWAKGAEITQRNPQAGPQFVMVAMRNAIFGFCKWQNRRGGLGLPLYLDDAAGGDGPTLAETIIGASTDDGRLLIEWLKDVLTPIHYDALRYRFQGYSFEDVARATGVEVGTARTRYIRGRRIAAALIAGEVAV